MEPKVAVLLPVFNEEDYISETLQSILDQRYSNWYCSIVDDGSSDNTARLVEDFIAGSNRFTFRGKAKNEGIAKTINRAASEAIRKFDPDYLMVFSGDDLMLPDCIQSAIQTIKNNDFLTFSYKQFQEGDRIVVPPHYGDWKAMLSGGGFSGFMMYKTNVWKTLKGYDETTFLPVSKSSFEDWDLGIRALKSGYKYTVLIEPKIMHRWHSKQETRQNMQVYNELVKLIRNKHE